MAAAGDSALGTTSFIFLRMGSKVLKPRSARPPQTANCGRPPIKSGCRPDGEGYLHSCCSDELASSDAACLQAFAKSTGRTGDPEPEFLQPRDRTRGQSR